jgi:D-alanine-D-alanine ligase
VNLAVTADFEARDARREVRDAAEFGRVAVLYGGSSSEREVSLDTGAAVLEALVAAGVDAMGWDPAERPLTRLASDGCDRAWIALHGPGGEDGALQGALEWLGIPYTGSGVLASALAMDKVRSKHLFHSAGIPTPEYAVLRKPGHAALAADHLGYPLIVKPSGQGSSVGMSKVFEPPELEAAVLDAFEYGSEVLVERCIVGRELTVAVLQGKALPSIRIETPRVFYDYRAKYASDRTEYFCPGAASDDEEAELSSLAIAAFTELGCRGWGRVDFMCGQGEGPSVLEVNTVPGMTSHSLVPMAARASGIDFPALCWRILETSMNAPAVVETRETAHGT